MSQELKCPSEGSAATKNLPCCVATDPVLVSGGESRELSFRLGAGKRLDLVVFVLDGGTISLVVDLVGEGAEFRLWGLSVDSHISVKVNHLAPSCTSRQLVKGIAGEHGGSFFGMIFVAPDAQHTDAEQYSRNIQLSDEARITTLPQLEIYADDVRCSHGATIGRLDEEAVLYLRSRGISESEARRMQLEGFYTEIIDRCGSEEEHKKITAKVAALL